MAILQFTQINLAYDNHLFKLSIHVLPFLSTMTFVSKAHLRDQISLSLLS
jgi:hypothetical protein